MKAIFLSIFVLLQLNQAAELESFSLSSSSRSLVYVEDLTQAEVLKALFCAKSPVSFSIHDSQKFLDMACETGPVFPSEKIIDGKTHSGVYIKELCGVPLRLFLCRTYISVTRYNFNEGHYPLLNAQNIIDNFRYFKKEQRRHQRLMEIIRN